MEDLINGEYGVSCIYPYLHFSGFYLFFINTCQHICAATKKKKKLRKQIRCTHVSKKDVADSMSSIYLPSFYLCPTKGSALPWQDVHLPSACVLLLFGSSERNQSKPKRYFFIMGLLVILFTR